MPLTKTQLRHLRALAHALKPVVWMGQHGLTEAVMAEIDQALEHHELIKLKMRGVERDEREQGVQEICSRAGAECVQQIGQTIVLYRRAREGARLKLPA